MQTIGVLGAGAWGTALAATAKKAGRDVKVWALEAEVAEALSAGKGNPLFLPDIELPKMQASSDMSILADCEAILSVVPAQHARACFNQLDQYLTPGVPVLLCSKGIEKNTLSLMTDVVHEAMPKATPAVLSGPSFAKNDPTWLMEVPVTCVADTH